MGAGLALGPAESRAGRLDRLGGHPAGGHRRRIVRLGQPGWTLNCGGRPSAVEAERDAKQDALDKLWRSHLARAQAGRFSGRPGQRLDSLAALGEASRIARESGVPAEEMDELRNEVIACLALTDLRPGTTSVAIPPGNFALVFDDAYRRYALSDAQGTISVYHFGDDQPFVRLPGLGPAPEIRSPQPGRPVRGRLIVRRASGLGRGRGPVGLRSRPVAAHSPSQFSGDSSRVVGRSARRLDRRVGPADGPGDTMPAHRASPRLHSRSTPTDGSWRSAIGCPRPSSKSGTPIPGGR